MAFKKRKKEAVRSKGSKKIFSLPPEKELSELELLKKIQEQLVFLERKIDTLVNQAQGQPFKKESSFSKPHFEKHTHGGHRFEGAKKTYFHPERQEVRSFDRGPREMFKAVCAACHKECEVPFRPKGDRPIFCSDCYSKNKNHNR